MNQIDRNLLLGIAAVAGVIGVGCYFAYKGNPTKFKAFFGLVEVDVN